MSVPEIIRRRSASRRQAPNPYKFAAGPAGRYTRGACSTARTRCSHQGARRDRPHITGLASTPTPDRRGDILEPLGATFRNPLPLLLHHDRERPVGLSTLTATAPGIAFEATLPEIAEPGVAPRPRRGGLAIDQGRPDYRRVDRIPPARRRRQGVHRGRPAFAEDRNLRAVARHGPGERRDHDSDHQIVRRATWPRLASTRPASRACAPEADHDPDDDRTNHELENKRAALAARMAELMDKAADGDARRRGGGGARRADLEVKSIDADLAALARSRKARSPRNGRRPPDGAARTARRAPACVDQAERPARDGVRPRRRWR